MKKSRILVISEDTRLLNQLETKSLAESYDFEYQTDDFRALKRLYNGNFDVILYDIDTNTLDAYLVIKASRTIKGNIPVIILTADNSLMNVTRIKNYDIDFLNFKPIDIDQLTENLTLAIKGEGMVFSEEIGIPSTV